MVNSEILNRKDPLTGFHTKEGLNEYLISQLTAVYDKVKHLSVIILDLDKFKEINDTHGHMVGDDALRYFSMVINTVLKGQYFVARYGGDEFVIVMPDSPDGKESLGVASGIKTALNKEKFYTASGTLRINSSIGIATYPNDAKTARTLLEAADKALYYVKKHGRDKVVSSRTLRGHSVKDKLFALVKILVVVLLTAGAFFSYQRSESFKGVVTFYQNITSYLQYQAHRIKSKNDYCSVGLKNGRRIEGWIIKEDTSDSFLSMTKPVLKLNPFVFSGATSDQPIKVPKTMIQTAVKILKAS